ncbi:MAG: hypothetical protein GY745_05095 [Actinomycetia bacterium]|nr:hypothetical protein [Actinomycetes bacterium]MCP4084417.1 hypothetical protein [Actinomycetes bacterium]
MTESIGLATVRREYRTRGLAETDLDPDPFVQFQQCYHDAQDPAAADSAALEDRLSEVTARVEGTDVSSPGAGASSAIGPEGSDPSDN